MPRKGPHDRGVIALSGSDGAPVAVAAQVTMG